ncbi:hypothetical protein [Metabacillus bambusae]|nr:hypothetical protein [Metabacillus bambusae]
MYSKKELEIIHETAKKETSGGSSNGYSKEELDRLHKELEKRNK